MKSIIRFLAVAFAFLLAGPVYAVTITAGEHPVKAYLISHPYGYPGNEVEEVYIPAGKSAEVDGSRLLRVGVLLNLPDMSELFCKDREVPQGYSCTDG